VLFLWGFREKWAEFDGFSRFVRGEMRGKCGVRNGCFWRADFSAGFWGIFGNRFFPVAKAIASTEADPYGMITTIRRVGFVALWAKCGGSSPSAQNDKLEQQRQLQRQLQLQLQRQRQRQRQRQLQKQIPTDDKQEEQRQPKSNGNQ
jgi:hypothetical protein